MAKVQKIGALAKTTNHYGGINFVIGALCRKKIPQIIDRFCHEKKRKAKQAKYSFSDIILGWIYGMNCGAEYIEDCNGLREELKTIPKSRFSSPDRIIDTFKFFAEPAQNYASKGGSDDNEICENPRFQDILMSICRRLEVLKRGVDYTLDYDTVVIPTEKKHSRYTYLKTRGYNPAMAFINKIPVYIQGRNGNTAPKYEVRETIESILKSLERHDIRVKRARMDEASYQEDLIDFLDQKDIDFFIRARHSARTLYSHDASVRWRRVKIGRRLQEVKSTEFWFSEKMESTKYRLVIQRQRNKSNLDLNKTTKEPYTYRAIITNNWEMPEEEVIGFYNMRGDSERNFDDILNSFNMRRLPFSHLNQNVVFMYVSAITMAVYYHLLENYSAKCTALNNTMRMKKFIATFIATDSEWVENNGKWVLLLDEEKKKKIDYDKLYGLLHI